MQKNEMLKLTYIYWKQISFCDDRIHLKSGGKNGKNLQLTRQGVSFGKEMLVCP